jgi:hypothetical protein
MKTIPTILAVGALAAFVAVPATGGAAVPSDAAPQFAAAPAVSFQIVVDRKGHFASLGAVVRLRHELTEHQRRSFGLIAGTRLRAGQSVPDELFGGTTLGRLGTKGRNCYAAEVAQLRRHASVHSGDVWRVAFADGTHVAAQVRAVRLVRGPSSDRAAAQRLGCFA